MRTASPTQGIELISTAFRELQSRYPQVSVVRSAGEMQDTGKYAAVTFSEGGQRQGVIFNLTGLADHHSFLASMANAVQALRGGKGCSSGLIDKNAAKSMGLL